jgi:hypothetical protein
MAEIPASGPELRMAGVQLDLDPQHGKPGFLAVKGYPFDQAGNAVLRSGLRCLIFFHRRDTITA